MSKKILHQLPKVSKSNLGRNLIILSLVLNVVNGYSLYKVAQRAAEVEIAVVMIINALTGQDSSGHTPSKK